MQRNSELTLQRKTAMVTGASGMIGRRVAVRLAELGADVYVHYRSSEKQAKETARQIEAVGSKAYLISGDLTKPEEVKKIFRTVEEITGELNILINNAGVQTNSYIKKLSESDWDNVINTNMKSISLTTQYAVEYLSKDVGSSVINISSIAALKAYITLFSYCASKAGVLGMTRVLAKELGAYGIRVNCISPGHVEERVASAEEENSNNLLTMMGIRDHTLSKAEEKTLTELTPLHRIGTPDDIADMAVFLCSPLARSITGQNLIVDGGYSLEWNIY